MTEATSLWDGDPGRAWEGRLLGGQKLPDKVVMTAMMVVMTAMMVVMTAPIMMVMLLLLLILMVMICYHIGALAWCQALCKHFVYCIFSSSKLPHEEGSVTTLMYR